MAGERLKGVMSDLAETIRRVFQAPGSTSVALGFTRSVCTEVPPLMAVALEPPTRFEAKVLGESCGLVGTAVALPLAWTPSVLGEPGWAAWSVGATVCELPLLRAGMGQRLAVPPLPRRAVPRQQALGTTATRSRSGFESFASLPTRGLRPSWPKPITHRALEHMLACPVAVTGEDLQKLSKALWMRYTLQLVRETGQNIRNLEVLGLYRIPVKGTRQVHHDPATGRLLVTLGPEAVEAKRAPFLIARQKDDNAIVCCFVEGT